jgi:DNA repair protein RecO (recombination protein O)
MAYFHSQALVLRHADYRENDRVLSLLTAQRGRVEVLCRGCRKPGSPLMAASQRFAWGDYVLYKGKGREIVTGCAMKDSFYPLRQDYDRLSYAAILLAAADAAAQPEQPQEHLLILLTRSLHRLAYSDVDPRSVTAAFLLHFASLQGYKPRLNHCALCGRIMEDQEDGWLHSQAGGLLCRGCYQGQQDAQRLDGRQIIWLRQVLQQGIDKTGPAVTQAPLLPLKRYVENILERRLPRLPETVPPL